MDLVSQVRRAVLWHEGRLPEGEAPASFEVHLAGPLVGPSVKVTYHTYVGLFPDQAKYVAIKTGRRPRRDVSVTEILDTIAESSVSRVENRKQRDLITSAGGVRAIRKEWSEAVHLASRLRLPVGFYAIGDVPWHERVLFLRVVLNAQVGLAIETFKRASPQIMFD